MSRLTGHKPIRDQHFRNVWWVETISCDEEGGSHVVVFLGPRAREWAEEYANWTHQIPSENQAA